MAAVFLVAACTSPTPTAPLPTGASPSPASLVHAREFFPYGVYIASGTLFDLRNTARNGGFASVDGYLENVTSSMERGGFNTVWPNNLLGEPPEYAELVRTWSRFAAHHGLRLIPQGGPFPGGTEEIYRNVADWPGLVEREILPFYRQVVPEFGADPALLVWSVGEEPPAEERDRPLYSAIRTVTEELARLDPDHPAIFLYHWPEGVEMGARIVRPRVQASNIGVFSGLEGFRTWTENTIYYTSELERRFQAAKSAGAPLWVMGTANEWELWANETRQRDGRAPTAAEIRWQVWAGLMHGARGYFWFIYQDLDPPPIPNGEAIRGMVDARGVPGPMYHAAAQAGRDIRPLHPLLLRLEPGPLEYRVLHEVFNRDEEYDRYWASEFPVRWRPFTHMGNGTKYWMAVNFDLERSHPALPSRNMTVGLPMRDVATGANYSPGLLAGLILPPGGGALLEVAGN